MSKAIERIKEVAGQLEQMRLLRLLSQTAEWGALRRQVSGAIEARIRKVLDPECSEKETMLARAEIRAWRWFLAAPEVTEKDIADARERLEGLQSKALRRQDLSLDTDPSFDTEIQRIEMLLQRTANP